MELDAGEWETAARLCDEAISSRARSGWSMFEPISLAILAEIDAYAGEVESARAEIPGLLQVAEAAGYFDITPTGCRARSRCSSSPVTMLKPAGARSPSSSATSRSWTSNSLSSPARPRIEALLAIGDLQEAERLLR